MTSESGLVGGLWFCSIVADRSFKTKKKKKERKSVGKLKIYKTSIYDEQDIKLSNFFTNLFSKKYSVVFLG